MIMPPTKALKNLGKQEKPYNTSVLKNNNEFLVEKEKDRVGCLKRAPICKRIPSNLLEKPQNTKKGVDSGEGKKLKKMLLS
jgi:hypothetical protein